MSSLLGCTASMPAERTRYKLSPRANRDLTDIWLYTRDTWSIAQADNYYRNLVEVMDRLASGTKRGKPIDDIRAGYLSCSSGAHKIIYRHSGRRITIVRILHQRMNVQRHL